MILILKKASTIINQQSAPPAPKISPELFSQKMFNSLCLHVLVLGLSRAEQ
jgi:hypothetical protein